MTRFPLRLRVALAKARLFESRNGGARNSPILYLRSEEILHSPSPRPVSHEAVRGILRDRNAIVWIGGSEPLAHPGIGHLTRLVVQGGHFLFLETDGTLLRQRIHEFQPSPRFYLTIRFLGSWAEHDRRLGQQGAFRAAMEGIRAAQLSGFLICAKLDLEASSRSATLTQFCAELQRLELDGMLISPASAGGEVAGAGDLVTAGWARFSRLVESAASAGRLKPGPTVPQAARTVASNASDGDCAEGARA
jgi:MoaA/NifB/PqqE/SkfB family radical SAM enzyme